MLVRPRWCLKAVCGLLLGLPLRLGLPQVPVCISVPTPYPYPSPYRGHTRLHTCLSQQRDAGKLVHIMGVTDPRGKEVQLEFFACDLAAPAAVIKKFCAHHDFRPRDKCETEILHALAPDLDRLRAQFGPKSPVPAGQAWSDRASATAPGPASTSAPGPAPAPTHAPAFARAPGPAPAPAPAPAPGSAPAPGPAEGAKERRNAAYNSTDDDGDRSGLAIHVGACIEEHWDVFQARAHAHARMDNHPQRRTDTWTHTGRAGGVAWGGRGGWTDGRARVHGCAHTHVG